jgi:hypothetical protein
MTFKPSSESDPCFRDLDNSTAPIFTRPRPAAKGSFQFRGKGLNLQLHAGNLFFTTPSPAPRALAKLRKKPVPRRAQLHPRSHQFAIHVHAGPPLKLKQQIDFPRVACVPAQDPSPTAQDRPRQRPHQSPRFGDRNGLHLQRPRYPSRRFRTRFQQQGSSHKGLIGEPAANITVYRSRTVFLSSTYGCISRYLRPRRPPLLRARNPLPQSVILNSTTTRFARGVLCQAAKRFSGRN